MRSQGEGTIGREGDGWVARLELPPGPNGRRRRLRRRAKTKVEAAALLKRMREQLDEVEHPDGLRRTVEAAVDTFLRAQPVDRAPKTVELEHWRASIVVAGLGARQLGKLSVRECDDFLARAGDGEFGGRVLSTETLRRVRRLLVRVLDNERRIGNLGRNVAELSLMPANTGAHRAGGDQRPGIEIDNGGGASERRSLTPEEFGSLWHVCRHPLLVIVDLCGRNGLRPAEARALQWHNVELDGGTLAVTRQLSSNDEPTYPKTIGARRVVRLDAISVSNLKAWKTQQDVKRARAGDRWVEGLDLVISTRYGRPLNRYNVRRMLTAACEQAGVDRIVPYELRHTAITLQRQAGRDSAEVADWAGTSERMVNEIYRHRLDLESPLKPVEIAGVGGPQGDPESGPNSGPSINGSPWIGEPEPL